jgi:hypothetical protein
VVAGRTFIQVVARGLVGAVLAARVRITRVVCAWILVVAGQVLGTLTQALLAVVTQRADIVIGAGGLVERIPATIGRSAPVVCADTVVVAINRSSGQALSHIAVALFGAEVGVVASGTVELVLATCHVVARIVGTGILVVACWWVARLAAQVGQALLKSVTGFAVVTDQRCSR